MASDGSESTITNGGAESTLNSAGTESTITGAGSEPTMGGDSTIGGTTTDPNVGLSGLGRRIGSPIGSGVGVVRVDDPIDDMVGHPDATRVSPFNAELEPRADRAGFSDEATSFGGDAGTIVDGYDDDATSHAVVFDGRSTEPALGPLTSIPPPPIPLDARATQRMASLPRKTMPPPISNPAATASGETGISRLGYRELGSGGVAPLSRVSDELFGGETTTDQVISPSISGPMIRRARPSHSGTSTGVTTDHGSMPPFMSSTSMAGDDEPVNTPRPMPASIGSYRVIREVARGGMAVIYEAKHPTLGRSVAIKVLHDHLIAARTASSYFLAEAVAISRISHPAVVSVFDHGYADNGAAYLVMELLPGESLARMLTRSATIGVERAIDIASAVAEALVAAHEIGIVHRDLKPDNVHLVPRPDGLGQQVKLLDFGVAKVRDELTGATGIRDVLSGAAQAMRGRVLGTLAYMAPEQLMEPENVDERADVYALGCLMYQMVTGKLPQGPGITEGKGGRRRVPSTISLNPTVPIEFDRLVMRMLEFMPDDRPATMREVARALSDMTPSTLVVRSARMTRPPAHPPASVPWMQRKMVVTWLVAGVAFALLQLLIAWRLHLL